MVPFDSPGYRAPTPTATRLGAGRRRELQPPTTGCGPRRAALASARCCGACVSPPFSFVSGERGGPGPRGLRFVAARTRPPREGPPLASDAVSARVDGGAAGTREKRGLCAPATARGGCRPPAPRCPCRLVCRHRRPRPGLRREPPAQGNEVVPAFADRRSGARPVAAGRAGIARRRRGERTLAVLTRSAVRTH